MRFSINIMQLTAVLWAATAVILAFVIVLSLYVPQNRSIADVLTRTEFVMPLIPWQFLMLMFFVFLLILILPLYSLLFLWHKLSES